jgi:hypothetical protein
MSCILISSMLSRNVLIPDPVDKTAAASRDESLVRPANLALLCQIRKWQQLIEGSLSLLFEHREYSEIL